MGLMLIGWFLIGCVFGVLMFVLIYHNKKNHTSELERALYSRMFLKKYKRKLKR